MKLKNIIKTVAVICALSVAGVASAVTVDLNTDGTSGLGYAGPYGLVEWVQSGSDVNFTVTLYNSLDFVNTGSHTAFAFNATGVSASDIQNIKFNSVSNGNYSGIASAPEGGETFTVGVDCTGTCSNGAPGALSGPLSFTVLNATVADFGKSSAGTNYWFGADIICRTGGCNGVTGAIFATGTTSVPEPATLGLLGLGLGGVGFARRRKIAA